MEGVSKTYNDGTVKALTDVSFTVGAGELFGLIGPDGAGKTTAFRILTTLLMADSGTARVNGCDVVADYRKIRRQIGYMPGRFSLYQDLSVEENLRFFATLFGTTLRDSYDSIREIYVQIEPFKKRKAGRLSGGMKQKLALCCALIHRPTVLFLDEPTTGVDAVSRKEFWGMLTSLQQRGTAILVSTPYMDEATRCNRIALIQSGQLLSIDRPAGIVAAYPGKLYAIRSGDMYRVMNDLRKFELVAACFAFGDSLHVNFTDQEMDSRVVAAYLEARGHTGFEMWPIVPTIEDCFIRLLK